MDPRSSRTEDALRDAILVLAARKPTGEITVAELVQEAGVSRKTFYNHAATSSELLNRTLLAELDEVRKGMDADLGSPGTELLAVVRRRLGEILQHVRTRRAIYTRGENGTISPELYRLLSDHFYAAIHHSIDESARRVPVLDGFSDVFHRAASVDMYAAYIAHAYAGVIQAWLGHPETDEVEFVLDLVVSALPTWMLERAK